MKRLTPIKAIRKKSVWIVVVDKRRKYGCAM